MEKEAYPYEYNNFMTSIVLSIFGENELLDDECEIENDDE